MAMVGARSGGGGAGKGAAAESREDIVLRVLEQVQLNMLKFQSHFNDLDLRIVQLEQAQKNLANKSAEPQKPKAELPEAESAPDKESGEPSTAKEPASGAAAVSSQEVMRLDGRIDVLVKELSILKKDLKLEDFDDKSLLLETTWKGGLGASRLNNTSMMAMAGDDLDNDEDDDTLNETTNATVASSFQQSSIFDTTKTENEDESNYAGGLGDDEDDDDNVAMTIQPEIYLDDYDDDQDDDTNDLGPLTIDEGDNSMDIDDDQSNDMLDNDIQYEAGSEDEQAMSAYFSYKGQRDNAIEYKVIKATGKHQCPLYPVCQVECLSRRNLMRHYYNTHASTVTFQCPVCGIGYARKDNLSKHYKKKHEDEYGPLQNAAAQARPRTEYEQQQMLQQQSMQQRMRMGTGAGNAAWKTRPGPVPRGMISGGQPRPHRCSICGISYNWRKNLNHHMKVKHGQLMPRGSRGPHPAPLVKPQAQTPSSSASNNYVTCRLCPTSFRTTEELARHYSIRHRQGGRPIANASTSSTPSNKPFMRAAAANNDGGASVANQCPVCYKLFSNREILKRHVSMHRLTSTPITSTITVAQTSITPTSSTSAAAAAAAAQNSIPEEGVAGVLGPDGVVHDKQCRICFKEFTRREHVKRHMKLHSGAERYACIACEKVYSRKDQLRQHQRQTHGQVLELEQMDNGGSEYPDYDQD